MPFITKADMASHIYPDGIDIISRDDDTKIDEAIDSAIAEAKMFLSRYDTDTIFATTGDARKPYANLITYIKDIAKWHFINLSNATIEYDVALTRYEKAIEALKQIAKTVMPGWPLLDEDDDKPFSSGSRPKFNSSGF